MSSFYLESGWYSSEQLADVLEVNKRMNDHLEKAVGELTEGQTLTTHKLKVDSFDGAAGSVVAMTQDNGVKLTFMQHPWVEVINEDGDVWILDPVLEVNRIEAATKAGLSVTPLYKKKEWVGLTDEEIEGAIDEGFAFGLDDGNVSNKIVIRYVRVIEAKLKEKNT